MDRSAAYWERIEVTQDDNDRTRLDALRDSLLLCARHYDDKVGSLEAR